LKYSRGIIGSIDEVLTAETRGGPKWPIVICRNFANEMGFLSDLLSVQMAAGSFAANTWNNGARLKLAMQDC
jgi:hypothetical protein